MVVKKSQFYSVVRDGGAVIAKLQTGYTDGEFNYYRAERGCWYGIDPQTGLAIANGGTKEKAQQNAKDIAGRLESIRSNEARYNILKARFEKLCKVSK